MAKGKQYNYTDTEVQYVIEEPEEYIIPECLDACKALWDKGIETFMCSNYADENYRWIMLSNPSDKNIHILSELAKKDSRYGYDEGKHYYKIIVPVSEHSKEELIELTKPFVIQDSKRYQSADDYLDGYKRSDGRLVIDEYGIIRSTYNPEYANATLLDALKANNEENLYVPSEGRVYKHKIFLDWHLRYIKSEQMTTKNGILEVVGNLKTEEDIQDFIKSRLLVLESESHETTIDVNNTSRYRDYISLKTNYKVCQNINSKEAPKIVFDDIESYITFLNKIKGTQFNEFTLFTDIMFYCHEYFRQGNNSDMYDVIFDRTKLYYDKMVQGIKEVSIKEIADKKVGLCSEYAGLAQNLFKILGIDSEIVLGTRDGVNHAYNLVYPKGYDNFPVVLFDSSFHIDFEKKDGTNLFSFGYFKILDNEEYQYLFNGEKVEIETISSAQKYHKMYQSQFGNLDDYNVITPNSIYSLNGSSFNKDEIITASPKVLKLNRNNKSSENK